jgi:hypothetical protein
MKTLFRRTPWLLCFTSLALPAGAWDDPLTEDNSCVLCHGDQYLWDSDTGHLFVTPEDLADDIHWQIGLRCHDCHGGNPGTLNLREAHAIEDGFRAIGTPADIPAFCGHCHSDEQYMKQANPDARNDVVARFLDSVHGRHLQEVGGADAATCTSCHSTHRTPAVGSLAHPAQMAENCGSCHQQQRDALLADVHRHAGPPDNQGVGTPLACNRCHGDDMHGLLPVSDRQSPVFAHNQVESCGQCHQDATQLYLYTRHGQKMQAGLLVAPVCSDCHGAHGILTRDDPLSTLHPVNVNATCGQCHRFVPDWVKDSVHGQHLPRPTTTLREPMIVVSMFVLFGSAVFAVLTFGDIRRSL